MTLAQSLVAAASATLHLLPSRFRGKVRLARLVARAFRGHEVAVLRGASGTIFEVPSLEEPIALEILAHGLYEAKTIEFILDHLPPDGVFVDIGANIGAISIPVAQRRPRARIVAIEASARMFGVLSRNIQRNGLANVTPLRCCVGAEDGVQIDFNEAPDGKFGMGSIFGRFDGPAQRVEQSRLDTLLAECDIDVPDVIKIDIEGAELLALAGADRALGTAGRSPILVFEFCDWAEASLSGQSPGDAQRRLLKAGFKLRLLPGSPGPTDLPMTIGSAMIVAERTRT